MEFSGLANKRKCLVIVCEDDFACLDLVERFSCKEDLFKRLTCLSVKPIARLILVYNICLISICNSVFDEATNKSVLNIERS